MPAGEHSVASAIEPFLQWCMQFRACSHVLKTLRTCQGL